MRAAPSFPMATTPASIRGSICTIWARARTSSGSATSTGWPRPAQAATRPEGQSPRMEEPTQFGYERVTPEEKTRRVRGVFDSVAGKYDVMNDVMSGGLHRLWKRFVVDVAAVHSAQRVLDLAGGTGDLARLFAARVGPTGV